MNVVLRVTYSTIDYCVFIRYLDVVSIFNFLRCINAVSNFTGTNKIKVNFVHFFL